MYSYTWDTQTHGYILTTQTDKFVANEIRPVFAEELAVYQGFKEHFDYNPDEKRPLLWAQKNQFFYDGVKVAQLNKIEYGKPISAEFLFEGKKTLEPLNVELYLEKNTGIMKQLVVDTLKRIKEIYDQYDKKCQIKYIGFSGGKDSVVLFDLCHRVLPLTIPAVFSDTDMELPDTYTVWDSIQKEERYKGRLFLTAKAERSAIENWQLFGPPSRVLRWCCSVHKSTPAILMLREHFNRESFSHSTKGAASPKFLCFVGVRGDESLRRSEYDDIGEGAKSVNQTQAMPILDWSAHELWLYIFQNNLLINEAYRKGLPRVGCVLCPQSSNRQTDFMRLFYKKQIKPFADEIIRASSRPFVSKKDAENFVYEGGWHARNNGTYLLDVIDVSPIESKGNQLIFSPSAEHYKTFLEWLKTFGRLEKMDNRNHYQLFHKNEIIELQISKAENNVKITFLFLTEKPDKKIISHLSRLFYKSICCLGCRACEVSCPVSAISFSPQVNVNVDRCIHCLKCNQFDDGCLRYHSKRNTKGTTMTISGVGKYQTFGLQPAWIAKLSEFKASIRENFGAGKPMVSSAVAWFREAGLIEDGTDITTTRLLTVGENTGFESSLLWDMLWIRLANFSPLLKWYLCNVSVNTRVIPSELDSLLTNGVSARATRKSALSSLFNLFKNSPLGCGEKPLVQLGMKGKTIESLTRLAQEPEPLVVLYGLYLAAPLAKRSSFTFREMQQANFEMPCIFPISAFGLSRDSFIRIVNGLATNYPSFITGSFTHGLDEVRLYPEEKTADDVIELMLGHK